MDTIIVYKMKQRCPIARKLAGELQIAFSTVCRSHAVLEAWGQIFIFRVSSLGTDTRKLIITSCSHLLLSFGIASGVTPSSIQFLDAE